MEYEHIDIEHILHCRTHSTMITSAKPTSKVFNQNAQRRNHPKVVLCAIETRQELTANE